MNSVEFCVPADNGIGQPGFLSAGRELVRIGGDSLEFQRVNRFDVRVDFLERSLIRKQSDSLLRRHGIVIGAARADVQIFLPGFREDDFLALFAFLPEPFGDFLLFERVVGQSGVMRRRRRRRVRSAYRRILRFPEQCCHDCFNPFVFLPIRERQLPQRRRRGGFPPPPTVWNRLSLRRRRVIYTGSCN